jgi:hypothetical protein
MVAMAPDANPPPPVSPPPTPGDAAEGDDPGDAAALAGYATALADVMAAAIPAWIERTVTDRLVGAGLEVTDARRAAATQAGARAGAEAGPALRTLLGSDIDAQTSTPLAIARAQVRWATSVLEAEGVAPVARDPFAQRQAPHDVYDLTPASFADIDPALAEPGLVWGAAKAHVHLARRRRAGDR